MKNTMKIFSLLMMLVLCTVLLASCGDALSVKKVEADPYEVIMDASQKQIDAMAERLSGPEAVLEKLAEGVSTYRAGFSVPDVADINFEAAVDAKTGAFSGDVAVGVQGVSVTGEIWGDKDQFALSLPVLLGSGSYGVNFDTFMEDLENSSTLAAFGLSWAELKDQLGVDVDGLMDGLSADGLKTSFETYLTEAEAVMKDKAPVVAEDENGIITVTYTLTGEDLAKYGELAFDMLGDLLGDLMDAAEMDMDLENMPEKMVYIYYLDKKTGDLTKVDMEMDGAKGTVTYSTDPTKPMDMAFDVTVAVEGDLTGTIKGALREVAEEGKSGLIYDFDMAIDGESTPITLSYIRNDADGKYEMKMAVADEGELVIGGELTYTETSLRFTVDEISIPGEESDICKFTFTAEAGGTVEPMPAYKNALNLTNEDLAAIVENLT